MRLSTVCVVAATAMTVFLVQEWISRERSRPMPPVRDFYESNLDEKLAALGYADWTEAAPETAGRVGVVSYDRKRAHAGYNLFNSRLAREALLLDMEGQVVHRWAPAGLDGTWHHIEMNSAGDLLVIAKDGYLARLDWDARVVWKREMRAHHDVAIGSSGEIYAISRELRDVSTKGGPVTIVDDLLVVLSMDGEIRRQISIHDLFASYLPPATLEGVAAALREQPDAERRADLNLNDIYHTNTVEWIDREVPPIASKGDLLVCINRLDLIAVIDMDEERVRWTWGPGVLDQPHQPTLTDENHILIFDNGTRRGWSRVVEMDPRTERIVWEYVANPRDSFFSATRGGSHRVANDNVLVTESDRGRVFEVTRTGRVVWEFYNPHRREEPAGSGPQRQAIYRMTRVEPSIVDRILASRRAHP